ncbi:9253_t:CDS:2, partial [Funneliformis mosseae]
MDKKFNELIAYDSLEDFSDTDSKKFNNITNMVNMANTVDATDAVNVTNMIDVTDIVNIIDALELFISKTFQNWNYVVKFMKKYAASKGHGVQIGSGSKDAYGKSTFGLKKEITTYFPIRVKQTIKATLNNCEFIITVVVGNKDNNIFLLDYMCQCNEIIGISNDLINAISEVYSKIFVMKTHYSGYSTNMDWHCAGLEYKFSLLHKFGDKQALFVSKIKETLYTVEIYQDQKLQTTY